MSFVFFISLLGQLALLVLFPATLPQLGHVGPYAQICACFVLFFYDVPVTYRFRLFGLVFSDKAFTYLIGLQFVFAHFPASLATGATGFLAGLMYRSPAFSLRHREIHPLLASFGYGLLVPSFSPHHR